MIFIVCSAVFLKMSVTEFQGRWQRTKFHFSRYQTGKKHMVAGCIDAVYINQFSMDVIKHHEKNTTYKKFIYLGLLFNSRMP